MVWMWWTVLLGMMSRSRCTSENQDFIKYSLYRYKDDKVRVLKRSTKLLEYKLHFHLLTTSADTSGMESKTFIIQCTLEYLKWFWASLDSAWSSNSSCFSKRSFHWFQHRCSICSNKARCENRNANSAPNTDVFIEWVQVPQVPHSKSSHKHIY